MKNLCKLFVIAAVLIFVVASCEKEGVYNPKKKIDRVYYSFNNNGYTYYISNTDKYVKEVWNWDKNVLKGISFYDLDGMLEYVENYSYDNKNRLSEISWGGNGKYTLTYDGKHLSRIEYIKGSSVEEVMEVSYDGKRLAEIKITDFDSDSKAAPMSPAIFRFFLPNLDEQSTARLLDKINTAKAAKAAESYIIKFEWDGKNIKKITEEMGPYRYTMEYTYDNMSNPFKGLFDFDEFTMLENFSDNNVVKETAIYDNEISEYTYCYTYDGKYPTTKTYNANEYSYTYYYEYK